MVTTIDPFIGVKTTRLMLQSNFGGVTTFLPAATSQNTLFQFPPTTGSVGQVLSTDGNGNLSWITVTGTGSVTSVSTTLSGLTVANNTTTPVIGGTLGIASGGTGATTSAAALNALLPSQAGNSNRFLTTNGAGVISWGSPAGTGTVTSVTTTLSGLTVTTNTTTPVIGGTLGLSSGGTGATTATAALNNLLPSQTGNANKYLTTNGAGVISWGNSTSVPITIGSTPLLGGTTSGVLLNTAGILQELPAGTAASGSGVVKSGSLIAFKPVVWEVSSIAALRAIAPSDASCIEVLGYYSDGDGGGGTFYSVTTGGPYTDNGGTIITQGGGTSSSAWLRVVRGETVSVRMFGAKGDSTTNDAPAIQAALDNAAAGGYRIITFPRVITDTGSSYYRIQSTIIIPSQVTLMGDGRGITYIRAQDCTPFRISAGTASVFIQDMQITAYSGTTIDPLINTGIDCAGTSSTIVSGVTITNVGFRGFSVGVNLAYTWNSIIQNCATLFCLTGVRLFGKSVNNVITSSFLSVSTYGIRTEKDGATRSEGLMVSDCFLGGNSGASPADYGIHSNGFLSLNVSNCIIDLIKITGIYASTVQAGMVSNCWIASPGAPNNTNPLKGIEIAAVNVAATNYYLGFTVTNCYFALTSANSSGVFVDYNNKGISVTNCSFVGAHANTYAVKTTYLSPATYPLNQSQVTVENCTGSNSLNPTPIYFATPLCVARDNYNLGIQWDPSQGVPSQGLVAVAMIAFDGTTGTSTVANGCSVTKLAVGSYRVTFNTKLDTIAYNPVVSASPGPGVNSLGITTQSYLVTSFDIAVKDNTGVAVDPPKVNVVVYN